MRILLDTKVLVWVLADRSRLDRAALAAMEDTANDILFSAVNIWEIAIKHALGRADFGVGPEVVMQAALAVGFAELPVRAATAARVANLPPLHRDPFDRLLIAQAIAEPAILYTADDALPHYSDLVHRVGGRQ